MALFRKKRQLDPEDTRMSLGDHLEELRGCVARGLIALVAACLLCIYPAKFLLNLIARPVILVLQRYGQPESFLATGPAETFLVYIKVVLIFGLLIAAPYILYELWSFVAAGLYVHEKRWVYRLVPTSVGLFLAGVAFMYVFVLMVSLRFLIGFSTWLSLPEPTPTAIERMVLHFEAPAVSPAPPLALDGATIPVFAHDPESPPDGAMWLNATSNKLKIQHPNGPYSIQLVEDGKHPMVTTHFRIGEYLTFVLILMLAFGIAFQMPLVVLFLARTGIVPIEAFRKYRKVVIFTIFVIASFLAPPDFMSHLLLSLPMWLLFELGVWLAARKPAPVRA